jgi:hypothetical protein
VTRDPSGFVAWLTASRHIRIGSAPKALSIADELTEQERCAVRHMGPELARRDVSCVRHELVAFGAKPT